MKVIVFGGAGFLGSHVADILTERGHEVTIYDMEQSKYIDKTAQKMVHGSILDEDLVFKTLKGADIAYNFAGISDIDECVKKPMEVVKNNVLGNSMILESSRIAKVKRYVFASSGYVYSNYGSFYKSSKQACELFIHSYNEKFGLKYTILRYGSLYGDRADTRNSIHRMITEALKSGTITYHGTGDEIREYIHVRDAAQMSVDILAPEFVDKNIMLTGPSAMQYKDILKMIKEILGKKIRIKYTNTRRTEHYQTTLYNYKKPELGRKLLSNQYIELGAGLLECIEDISRNIGKGDNG